jgi:2-methylisocitrate lyase-like PEP mutase family enzyme
MERRDARTNPTERAATFRSLHVRGNPLLLANAWDAGSARVIESCGAAVIATTSAGLAWSHGYPDGDALPTAILTAAIAEIARVLSVPLTADIEGGYSSDPEEVGNVVARVIDAGAVGINLEDGTGSPDLLCAKIAAAKAAAARSGVDLFVNARTDVYLKSLVPPDRAHAETIARAGRYGDAGCDGIFVPGVTDATTIGALATAVSLPLNIMVRPTLPPVAQLAKLGVSRVSSGSAISQAAYGIAQRAAAQFLQDGRYSAMYEVAGDYIRMNALLATPAAEATVRLGVGGVGVGDCHPVALPSTTHSS